MSLVLTLQRSSVTLILPMTTFNVKSHKADVIVLTRILCVDLMQEILPEAQLQGNVPITIYAEHLRTHVVEKAYIFCTLVYYFSMTLCWFFLYIKSQCFTIEMTSPGTSREK